MCVLYHMRLSLSSLQVTAPMELELIHEDDLDECLEVRGGGMTVVDSGGEG